MKLLSNKIRLQDTVKTHVMRLKVIFVLIIILGVFISCKKETSVEKPILKDETEPTKEVVVKSVLTAKEQASMSSEEIINRLQEGNENFVNNNLTQRDHSEQRRIAAIGQYPKAIVLSCVDSRVPVEDVFDLGIGDIFVARVAGNIENKEIIGSMEFATVVAGSKVVIVLGHTACGAVKHAIDNTDAASLGLDALQDLLNEIRPVVKSKEGVIANSKDESFTNHIIHQNVKKTIADIREKSPKMKEMEQNDILKIVGAVYNMKTGEVEFL
ncbi:carbonic anhydrase family protein [Flavivirga amylovorans]|uniref:Carbonic anhydrase family protein n=1 Tax=Flavivirga amylovorans TaxID=870486 RepID=A0ABT8X6U6_9FLAO|nr:carbonic anhydrase family protein [Flavivirga amylovorans]MDO5989730.1 carbonic anhydrase family protein [Flavivirga amylovorans]